MEHQEAIDTLAAEGYLLDELTDAERNEFELHFADCESCFAHVRDGVRFIHALPPPAKEGKPPSNSHWPAMAAAASLAFVLTAGIGDRAFMAPLRMQIAELRRPHIATLYRVAPNRAEVPDLAGNLDSILEFDVVTPTPAPPYTCTIVNARGEKQLSFPVSAKEAKEPVRVAIPAGSLRPGNYSVIVAGQGGRPDTIPFTVQ
jgi:hypothetical protein